AVCLTGRAWVGEEGGKVAELVCDVDVLGSQCLFGILQRSPIQNLGLRISPLAHKDFPKVARDPRRSNALGPERDLLDPQCLLELTLGGSQFALLLVDHGQIVEGHRDVGVLGTDRLAEALQRLLKERLGLGIARLVVTHACNPNDDHEGLGVPSAELALADRQSALEQTLGLSIARSIDGNIGETGEHLRHIPMLGAKSLLVYSKCAQEQWLGLVELALQSIEVAQGE